MSFVPGLGILKGMVLTFRNMLRPKLTVQYPEVVYPIAPRHRGRLILLYDEAGTLKCETCFQCAPACPIECIDMGGVDTRDRYHVHWGPAEQYAERREESALRRSGRPVPDPTVTPFEPIDLAPLDAILADEGYDPRHMLAILGRTQDAYGHLSVAALQHIATPPGRGTASSTASPPSTRTCASSRRAATCWPSAAAPAARSAVRAGCWRRPRRRHRHPRRHQPDGAVRLETTDCHGGSPGAVS